MRRPYVGTVIVSAGMGNVLLEPQGDTAARLEAGSIGIPSGASCSAVLCAESGDVLAMLGPSGDAESIQWARLAAAGPRMHAALRAALTALAGSTTRAASDARHAAAVALALAGPQATEQCDHCGIVGQSVTPTSEGVELCDTCETHSR